ncbi:hypothetical protein LPJ38_26835 [Bradyrhizobium daqingense]|uniref:Uncharacterized protein n=1 Tax=Bradyrhizobium daqingense TaxID=993502 RepID=A0A562LMM1_9BRAD|nr:hypothetical protein [Bradyrhizobium daqingense]TWI08847.1 hypothetical protein IQ17_01671 [Bradyrhizobium daqingense]UFS87243.1 hypothetical protein LPJ38_26835 [Bradyrhizobium daqingense]
MINIAPRVTDQNLPRASFSGPDAFMEFAFERRQYEAAVQMFAKETSPAGINASIAAARRYRFKLTRTEAREAAVEGLRESLSALGYDETEIRWHAARRGRRDRQFYFMDERTTAARWDELRKRRTH